MKEVLLEKGNEVIDRTIYDSLSLFCSGCSLTFLIIGLLSLCGDKYITAGILGGLVILSLIGWGLAKRRCYSKVVQFVDLLNKETGKVRRKYIQNANTEN